MAAKLEVAFQKATRADWLRLVGEALAGKPFETLVSRTYDDLVVAPLSPSEPHRLIAPIATNREGAWDIRQLHAGADPSTVNSAILEDIAGGASSIAIQLSVPGQFGLPARHETITQALAGVPLDRIGIALSAGDQYLGAAQSLLALWEAASLPNARRYGAIHADPLGHLVRTGSLEVDIWHTLEVLGQFVSANIGSWPIVRLLLADGRPYHNAGASEAEELAAMLASLVEYLRVLDYDDVPARRTLTRMSCALSAGSDLFTTIAKLRAARLLVARVADACGAIESARHVFLEVTTSECMLTKRDPFTNILRNTAASLAAILGGADVLTVLPFTWALGQPDALARRIARNTQIILAEESGLGRVVDPIAGSQSIETLTSDIAARAWSLFQEIEASGGMARAIVNGSIQEQVAKTAARRERDLTQGENSIVGVSVFADTTPTLIQASAHPEPAPIIHAGGHARSMPVRRHSLPIDN
jgi:methylmalonyl-CoA mutase